MSHGMHQLPFNSWYFPRPCDVVKVIVWKPAADCLKGQFVLKETGQYRTGSLVWSPNL